VKLPADGREAFIRSIDLVLDSFGHFGEFSAGFGGGTVFIQLFLKSALMVREGV